MSAFINFLHNVLLITGSLATIVLIFICIRQWFFKKQRYFARAPITAFESKLFRRLVTTFPQYHVLAQVAFSALITSDDYKIRRRFNRKVTDFVLLNQQLEVIAIIELDDASHQNKQQADALRDEMFKEAGYRVVRYNQLPSAESLLRDLR